MNASSLMASLGDNSRRYEYELRKLQHELGVAHERELRLQHDIGNTFQQIAGCQLAGGVQLSRDVQALLDRRRQGESQLREALAAAEARVAEDLQKAAVLGEEIAVLEAGINRQLESDPLYQQQVAALEAIEAQLDEMAGSYEELREECRSKLQGFQVDRLYRYLKGRHFGTEQYSAWPLLREGDRWIARLCNFTQNRTSELALLAIQDANEGAHGQREVDRAAQQTKVSQLYQAAVSGSDLPPLKERLATAQQAVQEAKDRANKVHADLDRYAKGTDEGALKASELLSRQLAEMSNHKLERLAGETSTPEDDALVRDIRDMRAELDELKVRVPFLETQLRQAEFDYQRAKQLERDLLSASQGQSYSEGMNLDAMLVGFMKGALSLSQVVNEVGSHRQAPPVASPSWSSSSSHSGGGRSSRSSRTVSSSSSRSTSSPPSSSSRGGGFSTSDSL